jgi:phosphopantothenoylcysteine decarboxylase
VPETCILVVCAAPLAARAPDIATSLVQRGWLVDVVLTPAAANWTDDAALTAAAGRPPRSVHRPADSTTDRSQPDAVVVAPATFNTVGKMACGIADTYAHGVLCEALGDGVPVLVVPMVNNRLWAHPAWAGNAARLTDAGVRWLSIHDGSAGPPQPVLSGTGADVVRLFEPGWITAQLPS